VCSVLWNTVDIRTGRYVATQFCVVNHRQICTHFYQEKVLVLCNNVLCTTFRNDLIV